MNQLKFWWRQPQIAAVIQLYCDLSVREQRMLRLTLMVVIAAVVLWTLALPVWGRIEQVQQLHEHSEKEAARLQTQLKAITDSHKNDPNQAVRNELAKLSAQQAVLDERINTLTRALVSPAQMISLLGDMLAQNQDLKTLSLQTLPPVRVDLGEGYDDVQLYRHSLQLTMEASYPALVAYLQRLDTLPWRLGWDSLQFDIKNYPRGEVTIQVSTLSRRQEVLGGE